MGLKSVKGPNGFSGVREIDPKIGSTFFVAKFLRRFFAAGAFLKSPRKQRAPKEVALYLQALPARKEHRLLKPNTTSNLTG